MASGLRCGAYTHTGGEKGEDEGVTWIGQTKHNSKHTHSTAAVTTPHAAGAPFIFFLPVAQTSWNHHCLMYNMRVLNHAANRSWATAVQHVAIHMWTGWKRVRMLNKTNSWIHKKLKTPVARCYEVIKEVVLSFSPWTSPHNIYLICFPLFYTGYQSHSGLSFGFS